MNQPRESEGSVDKNENSTFAKLQKFHQKESESFHHFRMEVDDTVVAVSSAGATAKAEGATPVASKLIQMPAQNHRESVSFILSN